MSSAESTQTKICKPAGKPFRVHTPTLLQMEAVECGAAALGILLHHYGVWASLEKLRVECGVSRDGSKAGNIIRVARMYGCEADGYKVDTAELFEDKADFPCIVFWDFNHFVVVEGWAKNKVFLNDPACGPRTVSWEEFDKSFTGVALVIKPGENFQKHGRPPSLLGGLLSRIGSGKLSLLLVFLASLGLVIPGLAAPVFNRLFIDDVLVGGLVSWITPLLLGIGASAFIRMMLSWLQGYYLLRLQTGLALRECSRFMWHVLRLPAQFFMQRYAGEIGTRVALNNEVVSFVSGELAQAAVGVLTAVFYLVVMVQYNMFLTSMAVLMALVNVLFLQLVWRTRSDANMRLLQDQGKLSSFSMGGLQMMPTIKACGLEDDFFARWAGYYSGVMTTQSRLAQLLGLMGSIPAILTAVNSAVVLVAGGLSVMSGAMSLGGLMAFQILSGAFLGAVGQFTALGNSIVNMRANVNRIEDVLAYDPDPLVDQAVDKPLERITGRISVDNVTFGYSRFIPPVVSNFSLELYPGKRVALVGGSGSGKSTIAKIISGLIEPWTGQVLFDGKPREYYDRASFISCLSVVDQSIFLFSGTVRDNLTLWDQTIRETDVIRGCEDACMHYDVVRRPGGYDANVEEGGGNFSGGQRQRLEIARALCRNPSVVILDEATSALDPVTESVIDNSLRRRGCSCIIVAHRLSTIRDADEIIVLDKGVVVQRGTHEELLADDNGHYAKLIADS